MTSIKNLNKKNLELKVSLSYKIKNGSIKVSENDLINLGVGIVEEVVITKVGEKEGLTIMLFSDSHIKSGNVLMSVSDANGLELEGGDKVTIKKLLDHNISKEITKINPQQNKKNMPKIVEKPVDSVNNTIQKPSNVSPEKSNIKIKPLIKKNKIGVGN